ncbi:MAG: hypothetical protein II383_02660 [Bacteroidales bacterium]|nr:hypothetical protein [Bacteroidales bacterium]
MDSFSAFIQEHDGADTFDVRFLTSVRQQFGADAERVIATLAVRKKLKDKVPQWFAEPSLVYPKPLAGEQCSSSATAFYKASLLQELAASAGKDSLRVADLTGGLGVDAWAFSQVATEVLYNEMDADLADAARHNFAALGRSNIRVSCAEITADSLSAVLGNFAPDVIFLDPARRSASGQKVFRLADCSPDLIALKDSLLRLCPTVLVKVSPMADIAQLGRELGDCLQAVHVVAVGDECKELLLLLQRPGDPVRLAVRIGRYAVQLPAAWSGSRMLREAFFQVLCDEEHPAGGQREARYLADEAELKAARWLFVPGPALTKAGAFNLPCRQFGLVKLGRSTHLYCSAPDNPAANCRLDAEREAALSRWGKVYEIEAVVPFDKAGMREVALRCPQADVTARNFPLTSEALRKKLGVKEGSGIHLFGARADFQSPSSTGLYLIISHLLPIRKPRQ